MCTDQYRVRGLISSIVRAHEKCPVVEEGGKKKQCDTTDMR